MPSRRPSPLRLLVAAALLVALAGCDLGAARTAAPTIDPSASPIIATETDFCDSLDVMESEHVILRQVRLRPGNRRALDDQFEQLRIAWQDMTAIAPRALRDQLEAMRWAVIELGLAIEDYTTTDRLGEAAEHVLRKDIAFDRTLTRLRARTTCPAWQPTPKPDHTPSPGPSASGSPAPLAPSAATGPSPAGASTPAASPAA